MSRFDFHSTPLSGLTVVQRRPIADSRGFFARLFCADEFRQVGFDKSIVQINHSQTCHKGTVRGMHFQYPPHAEIKIVSCLKGEIFDVAVDLRHGSSTLLHWYGEILSAGNARSLIIPDGFAHGFQALSDDCEIVYFVTKAYHDAAESGIHPQDPLARISWPLAVSGLSERDLRRPYLDRDFNGVHL